MRQGNLAQSAALLEQLKRLPTEGANPRFLGPRRNEAGLNLGKLAVIMLAIVWRQATNRRIAIVESVATRASNV